MQTIHHRIAIAGGGCAGIGVAARMCRALKNPDVAVIEPSETHYYQLTPPMSAPDFIKKSPLAHEAGWVGVDKYTMRHPRYPNVFSLGDASSLPASKTTAAVRQEAPTLAKNLPAAMRNESLGGRHDGYASCPLVAGYGKLIPAEFDYDLNPKETFPFNQAKERLNMYLLKKHVLPAPYWHGMLRGGF